MSWNWKEIRKDEEEPKEYADGTVTISLEEYRDLVASKARLLEQGQAEHDDWYREYCKNEELEKRIKELEGVQEVVDDE